MAGASVTLSLPQMIDCAVSFPECGSVNFVMLHSVLHVLVQQLELFSCNVEFKGKEGDMVKSLVEVSKNAPKYSLTEYVVSPPKDAGKHLERGKKGTTKEDTVHIDDIEKQDDLKTVVVIERDGVKGEGQPTIISKSKIDEIEKELNELKKTIKELNEMPGNRKLIDAVREADGKGAPVLEVFQSVALLKRMDAAEAQIQKLATMLEDLIKSNPNLGCPPGMEGAETICDQLRQLHERITVLEEALTGGLPDHEFPKVEEKLTPLSLRSDRSDKAKDKEGKPLPPKQPTITSPTTSVPDFTKMDDDTFRKAVYEQLKSVKEDIKKLHDNLADVRKLFQHCTVEDVIHCVKNCMKSKKPKKEKEGEEGGPDEQRPDEGADERLTELESLFQDISDQLKSMDTTFNNEFQNLQAQFAEMEKEFGALMEKIHVGMPGGEGQPSSETIGELYEKILGMQTDMESLADTATKLLEDRDNKAQALDLLQEEIDLLKTVKADKEDLEDALADKADSCAINRKVSHDQFDAACEELSKGIEEALAKLTQQEQLWQAALDEIQKEIGNKLDRIELGPLRDFINQKLKALQQRLKALVALKQETEAAGTKKFLKNVNCISCDKDVIMRKEMDPSLLPQPYALPPTRSMGPYLAYELDALRKQQKSLPTSRNLNHFESALHSKSPRPGEDHVCNRYCGGSHTITTPQQRVTRLGHFLNQWGPEAQPVCDTTKDDEGPLIISGRGTERKTSAEQKPLKDTGAGDAGSTVGDKKDSKESKVTQRRGSAEAQKGVMPKASKTSSGQKTPSPKAASKTSSAAKVSGRRTSQISNKSGASIQKQSSKTSAQKIPEETPAEVTAEAGPPEGGGEGPPPSEADAPGDAPNTEEVPAEENPAETQPAETQPAEAQPAETQPAEAPADEAAPTEGEAEQAEAAENPE